MISAITISLIKMMGGFASGLVPKLKYECYHLICLYNEGLAST